MILTLEQKRKKHQAFVRKTFAASVREHSLDLVKVFENAVDAAGWCSLNMEIAFLTHEIRKLKREIQKLKNEKPCL